MITNCLQQCLFRANNHIGWVIDYQETCNVERETCKENQKKNISIKNLKVIFFPFKGVNETDTATYTCEARTDYASVQKASKVNFNNLF